MSIGISNLNIFRNVGEANHTHIEIQHGTVQPLQTHLHLQTLLRQTVLRQLEELVVLVVNHLLVMMLTRRRHHSSGRLRSGAHNLLLRRRGSRHHHQTLLIAADDHLVRDVDELDRVHVVLQHRRVQTLLLHLLRQRLDVLAALLPSEPLDVPHVVHADHLRLAHVVHVQHVLVQTLLHHLLLQHLHRHAATAVVEVPVVLGDRAVVGELLVQVVRIQTGCHGLFLQRIDGLAEHLQVEEADVAGVDALLVVTPPPQRHDVERGLEGLLAQHHQLLGEVLQSVSRARSRPSPTVIVSSNDTLKLSGVIFSTKSVI